MAKIEESVKKQLTKLIVTFLKYYPVRIRNVGTDIPEIGRAHV